mmetsp:Transcript_11375/g.16502  ORF Transcript_11375/g.16502 Transcript_11375/m.16502 type:complete len:209 (+) Transcript_11375:129-755(+)
MMLYRAEIIKAIESLKDHIVGSNLAAIQKHVKASIPSDAKWSNTLFLTALWALVDKGDVIQVNDTTYKLSSEYKTKKTDEIRAALQMKEEKKRQEEQLMHHHSHHPAGQRISPTKKSVLPVPSKEPPKKKPEKAKKKLTDVPVVTLVKERLHTERMDMSPIPPEDTDIDAFLKARDSLPAKKAVPSKTKLLPRKILMKRLISDPMKTS